MIPRTMCLAALAALCLTANLERGARAEDVKQAEDLTGALLKAAPNILQKVKERKHQNIGVLKFLVKKGDGRVRDDAGSLNLDLARRLELAMILANYADKPVSIIRDASATAAELAGEDHKTNHLNAAGRKKLFGGSFRLAGNGEKVKADAFLTGEVEQSPNMRKLTVTILCVGKEGGLEDACVARFDAAAGADDLVGGGESFLLRGPFKDGKFEIKPDAAAEDAVERKEKKLPFPLQPEAQPPVALEIYYDGKPVDFTIKDGKAQIPEPNEGQKVTFGLRRTAAAGDERLAVVLKINGENTLYRQRQSDEHCAKWILEPNAKMYTIGGFQKDNEVAGEFKVLSRAASKEKEIDYGVHVGTISLTVYLERKEKPKSEEKNKEAIQRAVISRGVYPEGKYLNEGALREVLKDSVAAFVQKGIIKDGQDVKSKVIDVNFNLDPRPVMSAVITYYRP